MSRKHEIPMSIGKEYYNVVIKWIDVEKEADKQMQ